MSGKFSLMQWPCVRPFDELRAALIPDELGTKGESRKLALNQPKCRRTRESFSITIVLSWKLDQKLEVS
jgi:hypothetical protein